MDTVPRLRPSPGLLSPTVRASPEESTGSAGDGTHLIKAASLADTGLDVEMSIAVLPSLAGRACGASLGLPNNRAWTASLARWAG
jgi:hypothetical protein